MLDIERLFFYLTGGSIGCPSRLSLSQGKDAEQSDERILGSGDFVERIVSEAEERQERLLTGEAAWRKVEETIRDICKEGGEG